MWREGGLVGVGEGRKEGGKNDAVLRIVGLICEEYDN